MDTFNCNQFRYPKLDLGTYELNPINSYRNNRAFSSSPSPNKNNSSFSTYLNSYENQYPIGDSKKLENRIREKLLECENIISNPCNCCCGLQNYCCCLCHCNNSRINNLNLQNLSYDGILDNEYQKNDNMNRLRIENRAGEKYIKDLEKEMDRFNKRNNNNNSFDNNQCGKYYNMLNQGFDVFKDVSNKMNQPLKGDLSYYSNNPYEYQGLLNNMKGFINSNQNQMSPNNYNNMGNSQQGFYNQNQQQFNQSGSNFGGSQQRFNPNQQQQQTGTDFGINNMNNPFKTKDINLNPNLQHTGSHFGNISQQDYYNPNDINNNNNNQQYPFSFGDNRMPQNNQNYNNNNQYPYNQNQQNNNQFGNSQYSPQGFNPNQTGSDFNNTIPQQNQQLGYNDYNDGNYPNNNRLKSNKKGGFTEGDQINRPGVNQDNNNNNLPNEEYEPNDTGSSLRGNKKPKTGIKDKNQDKGKKPSGSGKNKLPPSGKGLKGKTNLPYNDDEDNVPGNVVKLAKDKNRPGSNYGHKPSDNQLNGPRTNKFNDPNAYSNYNKNAPNKPKLKGKTGLKMQPSDYVSDDSGIDFIGKGNRSLSKPKSKSPNPLNRSYNTNKSLDRNYYFGTGYNPSGYCFACDVKCSVSTSGYSIQTFSPYNSRYRRRNVTPLRPGTAYVQYTRHKKVKN